MPTKKLEQLLYQVTESECWHLIHPDEPSPRFKGVERTVIDGQEYMVFDWSNTLHERSFGMIRETRFTNIPPHINRDMELSVIYSGSCDFVVNGRTLHLTSGDVLICDANVVRSSPSVKSENDIVISMVFRKEFFDSVFLSHLPGSSLLTNLLFDVIARNRAHDQYLMLPAAYATHARTYIELLFEEYHFSGMYSTELFRAQVSCLFLELIRGLYHRAEHTGNTAFGDRNTRRILAYIEQNYKECTLASTAREFGYNTNYLGNLLKRQTGRSFSEIKLEQQLSEAAYLLANTRRSIERIANKVGISNMTYFYRKFEAKYHVTPRVFRLQAAGEHENPR